jgi:hypothetical protein
MVRVRSIALGCVCAASVAALSAQDSSQAIPTEVVTLLMSAGAGSGAGELRPGAPANFPAGLFPPGATVNATMVSPARGTIVVATAPKLTTADFARHEDQLVSAGWTSSGPGGVRGFMSSPVMNAISVCRDMDFVMLTASPREAGGLLIRAALTRDPRRSCVGRPEMTMFADITIPRLTPPPNSRSVGGGGSSSGMDTMTTSTRLETTLEARAVADHYEKVLVAGGWKVVGRIRDGDDLVLTRFEVPSKAGPPLVGMITVTSMTGSGDQDVFLRIVRTTREPRPGGAMSLTPSVPIAPGVR